MKKLILLMLLVTAGKAVLAQGIYFKAGGGYAIPVASQVIGELETESDDFNTGEYKHKTEAVNASFGAGTNFLVGGGFMFNEFIGAELTVQYTMGKKFETGYKYRYIYSSSTDYRNEDVTETFSNTIFINPSIVVTPGAGTKVPYGRFGIVAASTNLKTEASYYYDGDGVYEGTEKWEYTGGMGFGFQGAVGMNWMINDKIDIFTEVNFVSMTYYAQEGKMVERKQNGVDLLPDTGVYYKEVEFKKELDLTGGEPSIDEPRQALRESAAFSSLSFQVGIIFLLNGHGEN